MMSILHLIYPVRNNAPLEFLTGFTAFCLPAYAKASAGKLPSALCLLPSAFYLLPIAYGLWPIAFQSFPSLDYPPNYPKEVS
jgi:hypothetical protein